MRLFLDCEFNSAGGQLISMALVSEEGNEFYEVLPCDEPHPWVAEHVMPILNKPPISPEEFQQKLEDFLMQYATVEIVADWPADIAYFCGAMLKGTGASRIDSPAQTVFRIFRIDAPSELPHNALADAHGIRKMVLEQGLY